MSIGKRISKLRKENKLSQEYLAEAMGVSRQAVSKWENDQTCPDTENLSKLAELFGVTAQYLATGKEPESPVKPRPSKLPLILKRTSLAFFLIALVSHCYGLLSGEFTRNLIPVFPYLWYGKSALAIVLNAFTVLFTIGWVSLLAIAMAFEKEQEAP